MRTRFETRCSDKTLSLSAGLPNDFSLGVSQNAIWVVVRSSGPSALSRMSLLDDLSPAPSFRDPASVGLKHSAQKSLPDAQSKLDADWSCRPWSWLSMNSLSFHFSEWIAPASRSVVEMTISDEPALPRIIALPDGDEVFESVRGGSAAPTPEPTNHTINRSRQRYINNPCGKRQGHRATMNPEKPM